MPTKPVNQGLLVRQKRSLTTARIVDPNSSQRAKKHLHERSEYAIDTAFAVFAKLLSYQEVSPFAGQLFPQNGFLTIQRTSNNV